MPMVRAYMAICDECYAESDATAPRYTTADEYRSDLKKEGWQIKRGRPVLCPSCKQEEDR